MNLPARELLRALGNGVTLLPVRAQIKTIEIRLVAGMVAVASTDGYAGGITSVPVAGEHPLAVVGVPRSVAVDIEAVLRVATAANSTAAAGMSVVRDQLRVEAGGESVSVDNDRRNAQQYDEMRRVLVELPGRAHPVVDPLCVDPLLFARFGRIRSDVAQRKADLFATTEGGEHGPVLIKIGPDFVGFLMPIRRDVYEDNFPGGLW